jgi:hypothetical protein
MDEKVPEGGVTTPGAPNEGSVTPQQATVPSVFTPHVENEAVLADEKVPESGVAWP